MDEKLFFIIFGVVVLGSFLGGVSNNLEGDVAKDTAAHRQSVAGISTNSTISSGNGSGSAASHQRKPLTEREENAIKRDIEELYDEVWELEQDIEALERKEPVSRYAGLVSFTVRRAGSDISREHFILKNFSAQSLNISDWYIESLVTDRKVAIPQGLERYRDTSRIKVTEDIVVPPDGRAFLISGDSPFEYSFKENSCMGYLNGSRDVYPSLTRSCQNPRDLMERYANIELNDDDCHTFINRTPRCSSFEEDDPRLDYLSLRCERFIERHLNYEGCVENFGDTPWFDEANDWYVFLERSHPLWRNTREIIRLIDEYDEVVAVIEY